MKRILSILLICAAVFSSVTACGAKQDKDVTCEDVIAAYEEAGYGVTHLEYPDKDYGYLCNVIIRDSNGESSISFKFFETDAEAQAEADASQWNVILWLYSAAMFQPTWLHTEHYRNIEIEYDDTDLYGPFRDLIK